MLLASLLPMCGAGLVVATINTAQLTQVSDNQGQRQGARGVCMRLWAHVQGFENQQNGIGPGINRGMIVKLD